MTYFRNCLVVLRELVLHRDNNVPHSVLARARRLLQKVEGPIHFVRTTMNARASCFIWFVDGFTMVLSVVDLELSQDAADAVQNLTEILILISVGQVDFVGPFAIGKQPPRRLRLGLKGPNTLIDVRVLQFEETIVFPEVIPRTNDHLVFHSASDRFPMGRHVLGLFPDIASRSGGDGTEFRIGCRVLIRGCCRSITRTTNAANE